MRSHTQWATVIWLQLVFLLCGAALAHAVTPKISAGGGSTAALKQDGTVWGVGSVAGYWPGALQPARMFSNITDATQLSTSGADFALRANGELWAVGRNESGQTGDGTTNQRSEPFKVLENVVHFSGNHMTGIAALRDGTVWAWGDNSSGQIGDGTRTTRLSPVPVAGLAKVVMVAAGGSFNAALTSDGHVWVWGGKEFLANGDTHWYPSDDPRNYILTPQQVPNLSGIVSIAAGWAGNLALDASGKLWSHGGWLMGDGAFDNPLKLPVQVAIPGKVVAFSVGWGHALAVTTDGSMWAWGKNGSGQLGIAFSGPKYIPAKVSLPGPAIDVAAGFNHTAVLLADGRVMTFGDDSSSQLGRGWFQADSVPGFMVAESGSGSFSAATPAPAKLGSPPQVGITGPGGTNAQVKGFVPLDTSLTASASAAAGRRIVSYDWVSSDGAIRGQGGRVELRFTQPGAVTVYAIATDDAGLKAAAMQRIMPLPPDVKLEVEPQIAAAGSGIAFNALSSAGAVYSWGAANYLGSQELQSGAKASLLPADSGLRGIVKIATSSETSLALTQSGLVLAWAFNNNGALGDGSTVAWTADPVLVQLPKKAIDIVGGGSNQAFALLSDGTVWAWGGNDFGQLGLSDTVARNRPEQIPGLANVVAIAASSRNGYAIDRDANLWAWGDNSQYQLGQGDDLLRRGVVKVPGLPPIAKVTAGDTHVLAIARDGAVFGWSSWNGFLGDPGIKSTAPAQIPALRGFTEFASETNNTLGIKSDGSVWTWGSNWCGGIPGSDAASEPSPIPVAGIARPLAMTVRYCGGAMVLSDGHVVTWGQNDYGQIGDGTLARRRLPVLVLNPQANGFLALTANAPHTVPSHLNVPFFVTTAGSVSESKASVVSSTRFNPSDNAKDGAVFITASVPGGALGTTPLTQSAPSSNAAKAGRPRQSAAAATSTGFTLIQLTPTGWKTVVNGQLIPYASGVLGDQLAAQTILNGTDTAGLKGAEFCVGYGTSAQGMLDSGNIRAVATIPGATTTTSCVVGGSISVALTVAAGWNLLGNPVNQSIAVADKFGDASKVTSVWKWDSTAATWQFYTPGMGAAELQAYAASQGFGVLTEINGGDGFWVNARVQADLGTITGASINLRESSLATGWNLVATASATTPQNFNLSLSTTPPTAGQVPINMTSLWAWDSAQSNWYFYAPSLDAQGGSVLAEYVKGKQYQNFATSAKTLGNGNGFWVQRP